MKKTISFLADRLSPTNGTNDTSTSQSSSYLKRREQVRRAQRAHRERKDKYFKALESEVLHLRKTEINLVGQMDELNAYIIQLQDVLKANGIAPPPPPSPAYQRLSRPRDTSEHAAETDRPSGIHDDSENNPSRHTVVVSESGSRLSASASLPQQQITLESDPQRKETIPTTTGASGVANGMEFVLTLERPCLGHMNIDLTKSDQPSGHILTASMPLLQLQRYPQSFNSQENPSLGDSLSIFDRLTTLSSELAAEDEYTPIQLWNHIVNSSNNSGGGKRLLIADAATTDNGDGGVHRKLQTLAETMLQHVQCHGFGAVLKKDICEKMISEMFTE